MSKRYMHRCPTCNTLNDAEERNCVKCGHWMLSTRFPPKIVKIKSKARRVFAIVGYTIAAGLALIIIVPIIILAINNQSSTNAEKSGPVIALASDTGSRTSPIPVGKSHDFSVEQYNLISGQNRHQFDLTMAVNRVARGEESLKMVKGWNEYNPDLAEGNEYPVAKITVQVRKAADKESISINQNVFSLVSKSGVKYDPLILMMGSDSVYKEVYEGAKYTGWAVFTVSKSDTNPLIEVAGNWFAAY